MSRINLNKNVFNKSDFLKTINTSFTQLVPPTPVEVPVMNVDEFFAEYDRLFYEIQALLDEIASLRQELLDLNNENFNLQLDLSNESPQSLSKSNNTIRLKSKGSNENL